MRRRVKRFFVQVMKYKHNDAYTSYRIVPARSKMEAINNCSDTDIVIDCEPYDGQDLKK